MEIHLPVLQAGWSDVIFNNGLRTSMSSVTIPTIFYRMQISKGTDQTYILNIDADNSASFQLMGRNEQQDYNPGTTCPTLPNLNAIGFAFRNSAFWPQHRYSFTQSPMPML